MDSLNLLQRVMFWAIPVYLSISVHELAHGLVALALGDGTARRARRLTLNPLRHIDPVGSLVVPAVLMMAGGFIFGWARAMPVDPRNFGHPVRDMAIVAAAGPLSNLLMSLGWAFVMKFGLRLLDIQPLAGSVLVYAGAAGVFINAAILMLNLLPLPPLDGGRILAALLPGRAARRLISFEPWGMPLLLVLILAGMAGKVIWPLMAGCMAATSWLAALPPGLLANALRLLFGVTAQG